MCLHWGLTTAACCSAGIKVTVLAPPVRVLLVCAMCARAVLRCVLVCEGIEHYTVKTIYCHMSRVNSAENELLLAPTVMQWKAAARMRSKHQSQQRLVMQSDDRSGMRQTAIDAYLQIPVYHSTMVAMHHRLQDLLQAVTATTH